MASPLAPPTLRTPVGPRTPPQQLGEAPQCPRPEPALPLRGSTRPQPSTRVWDHRMLGPMCSQDTNATDESKASEAEGGPGPPGVAVARMKSPLGSP